MKKIAIIGSGPAGVTSALSINEHSSQNVEIHIFEQSDKLCKTILATGNGRCNFSNVVINNDEYHNSNFVEEFNNFKQEGESVIEVLSNLGLEMTTNDAGLMFPSSMKASSVRDVLLVSLNKVPITKHINSQIQSIEDLSEYDAIIIASGHHSSFNLSKFLKFRKILCPIVTNEDVSLADNVRSKVRLKLIRDSKVIFEECGEVQFRQYGISGVVTFNASRYARKGDLIKLDFTNSCLVGGDIKLHFKNRFEKARGNLDSFFNGFLHKDLSKLLIKRLKKSPSFEDVWKVIASFELSVKNIYEDEKLSQVSRGGFDASRIDPKTLKLSDCEHDNVYVCGEVVDVDGPCGGYNLTWAFESGWRVGKCACLKKER